MKERKCYILAAEQVSNQFPLSREWMDNPLTFSQKYVRAQEPVSREFILPAEARRMSRILKRAVCTSLSALNHSGIKHPDAVISGTGTGCFENTENFLVDLSKFGEHCLKPTLFMQSTHNTISSLIAIILKCHGYNNTYSHRGISFDTALLDGWMRLMMGREKTVLIGAHDEVTPFLSMIISRSQPEYNLISETSVSVVLADSADYSDIDGEPVRPLCELVDMEILHKPAEDELLRGLGDLPANSILMVGMNDNEKNDAPYHSLLSKINENHTVLKYKPLFGDNFSSSAIGFYAAAVIIDEQRIPAFMIDSAPSELPTNIDEIRLINHSEGVNWSIIRLRKVAARNCNEH